MDLLSRGVHLYGLLVGGVLALALVWGSNRFVFHNTTGEIGWPVLIGVAVLLTTALVGLRQLIALTTEGATSWTRPELPHQWNNRK